jgi:hypothetical protein
MAKKFTVSDGKLVLTLVPAGGGWYAVTCPLDPAVNTQARSVEEAFLMANDALRCLRAAREKRARELSGKPPASTRKPRVRKTPAR